MGRIYKRQRYRDRIRAATARERYRDVHVFVGGTGAVGGSALFKMLAMYEDIMAVHPPEPEERPVFVVTGKDREEIADFVTRLFTFLKSRHGFDAAPTKDGDTILTRHGCYIILKPFVLSALPELTAAYGAEPSNRTEAVQTYLRTVCRSNDPPAREVVQALQREIGAVKPFGTLLCELRQEIGLRLDGRHFRSVIIGIPLSSFLAYHMENLDRLPETVRGLDASHVEILRRAFREAVRNDLRRVKDVEATHVLVAHTTAVGGMYDVDPNGDRHIRLAFAHAAQDKRLQEKQNQAEKLADLYREAGISSLETAAAIGIDAVRVRAPVRLQKDVADELKKAAENTGSELFRAAVAMRYVHMHAPQTLRLTGTKDDPIEFEPIHRGREIRPSFALRSGENGYLSVANAEALYRVMRVASCSEVGTLLANVALLGDDDGCPWFNEDNVCYYNETDNARQVFDFLAQPLLRRTQLSGLEPQALQDLGSAKHQGELHTLGLLILLHRLRTLDIDTIPAHVDDKTFDAKVFFEDRSRPLTFEDIDGWSLEALARDLAILVTAESIEDIRLLKRFRSQATMLFPARAKALDKVLMVVLEAVRNVTSLGSPIVFERDGETLVRVGHWIAPLGTVATSQSVLEEWFRARHQGKRCTLDELREYHFAVNGFIDVRPHAVVCDSWTDDENISGRVHRVHDEDNLRRTLDLLEPFHFFATGGLLATLFRLRRLSDHFHSTVLSLGTLSDEAWQMPRDEQGHILLVPGIVESMRMVVEGLEKVTGMETLDGQWGYERRRIPERRNAAKGEL